MPAIGVVVGTIVASEMASDLGGLTVLIAFLFWWSIGAFGGILAGAFVATALTAKEHGVAKCWQWLIWSK